MQQQEAVLTEHEVWEISGGRFHSDSGKTKYGQDTDTSSSLSFPSL